ncbi:MAG: hypothetical protein KDB37_21105 [Ilumatobacter sp.]|nr:hypothetical protein [Ilumatobacter sp.]
MASSSSSTKKAAKLAQKGKGQKVRFQGGTVFPLAVAITLIVGLGLIVYARQSVPAADQSPPTINDHWHAAYGFYLCDGWVQLNGNLEERNSQGQFTNINFVRSGIHSHDDGVIHWHPYTSRATGRNATLGVFLESYDVELNDDSIVFPSASAVGPNPDFAAQAPSEILAEYIEGETQCAGEDAEVTVKAWGSFTDTDGGNRYIANMDNIHVDNDGMVFAIYFTPADTDQVMPPWAQNLPELGAIDSGQLRPEDLESLLESDSTVDLGSLAPSDTTVDTTVDDTVATDDTTADTTVDEGTEGDG